MANDTFTVTETIVLAPGGDTDLDAVVDPGETVRTTVQITNNSVAAGPITATGVEFTQILAGMTLFDQPGRDDVNVSPIVFDDSYNVIGNTTYSVSAADGIFGAATAIHATEGADAEFFSHTIGANPATQTAIVTTGTFASSMGGSVTLNADGSFSYSSATGFTGADSFSYTLRDVGLDGIAGNADDLMDTGTVSLNVEQSVWFIDNSAGVNGDGTQANPFNSIANFNAVNTGVGNNPGTGDFVFLREGTGTYAEADGINLLNNQTLVGQGESLSVNHSLQGNIQVATGAAGDTPVILVTGAANQGIQLAENNTIRGLDVGMNNATAVGIKDNGGTVGTLTISNVGIGVGSSVGQAIEVDNGGTINILLDSLASSGAGIAVDLANVSGTGNHFTVNGTTTIADATADGIFIGNTSANATFTGKVTILNDAGGANGDGVDLTTNSGTYSFNGGVDLTVNGTNAFGFRATSSGTVNILDPGGNNQITSNNGTALFVNPTQFNASLASVTAGDGGSGDGIHLEGVSGTGVTIGTVSITGVGGDGLDITNSSANIAINGGTIGGTTAANDATGIQVDVNGGSGNVTIGATVGDATSANDLIEVTGRTAGTIDFNGALTSTAGGGIDINTNTGGTVRFDGGMNLSTGANTAFNASGNSNTTLVVTDTVSTANILSTAGAAAALNVSSTTIGAEDLTFQSVSASGGTNGIVLNTTGTSGGLTVTGTDGGDAGTVPDAGTGGTIQNTTGDGILLTNTMDLFLGGMTLTGNDGDGIGGSGVNGFVLDGVTISGSGTSDAADHSGINLTGLTGTALAGLHATEIRNSTITNNHEFEIQITNSSGTLSDFRVTNSTISSNGATAVHGNLFNFLSTGTANMALTVAGSTFTGSTTPGQLTGTGVSVDASGGTIIANVGSSTFTNNNVGVNMSAATTGTLAFVVNGNTITGSNGNAINFFTNANHTATASGTISSNTVGTQGVAGSGSVVGRGIRASNEGSGTTTLLITNNIVQSIADFDGLFVFKGVTAGTMNATITNNTFRDIAGDRGLNVQTGTAGSVINTSITGNQFINVFGTGGSFARVAELPPATPGVLNITQADHAALAAANGLNTTTFVIGGTPQFNQPAPPLPLLAGDLPPDLLDATPVDNAGGDTPGGEPVGDQAEPDVPPVDGAGDAGGEGGGEAEPPAPHPVIVDDGILSQAELDWFVDAAIAQWIASGIDAEQLAALEGLVVSVTDMAALQLGSFQQGSVQLDNDGAGHGWFLDPTPLDNSEFAPGTGTRFTATTGSPAVGHYDLLTTIVHEMGHALGLSDIYSEAGRDELMYGYLFVGERRLPGDGEADGAVVGAVTEEAFAGSPITVNGTSSTSGSFNIPAGETVTIQWDSTIDAQTNQLIVNPQNTGTVTATNPPAAFPDATSNTVTTALDSLTLGGTVWNDDGTGGGTGGNGTRDGTEAGVSGVSVTLFADTGTVAGSWDASDAQVGVSQLTGAGGDYSFTGLAPGEYIVRVDQDNFDAGGNVSLLGLQGSATTTPEPVDPDDNVDNDDNGARAPGEAAYSNAITLAYNTEPVAGVGNDTNTTLDFAFLAPDAAPTLAATGLLPTFTEDGAAVDLFGAVDASAVDAGQTFASMTLTVSNVTALGGESLFFDGSVVALTNGNAVTTATNGLNVTVTVAAGTATVTFSGATLGELALETLIDGLTYNNTSQDPTDLNRVVTLTQLVDSGSNVAPNANTATLSLTATVNVNPVNDEPVGGDETIVLNEDDVHPFSASDFNFTDTDGDSLTEVVITTLPANGALFLNGVEITLAGTAVSAADIGAGLLTFEPAANGNGAPYDSFTFQVRDNGGTDNGGQNTDQSANTITVDVTAVNDAPVNVVGPTVNATEDDLTVVLSTTGAEMSVSDVDAPGNIVYSLSVLDGVLNIRTDVVGGITAAQIQVLAGTGNGTDTINILATAAQINATLAALNGLVYTPDANFAGNDTLTVFANDGGATGLDTTPTSVLDGASPGIGLVTEEDLDTRTITVAAVDDPATAQNDAVTTNEATAIVGASVFTNNGSGADSDVDGPPLTVTEVNGVGASVGTQITLASGALLTVNAGGTFDYDPNGAFDVTPVGPSGAANTPATDSFTYTLAGGSTATVTVTITGLDSNDLMFGTAGNDVLVADGGSDTLVGFGGDDQYYVNAGDTVVELAGQGTDRIFASVHHTMGAGVHVERLTTSNNAAVTAINLTGNELANLIYGNAGANVLDGGTGADALVGFGGDDWYYVDNAADAVFEVAGGGAADRIFASVSYQLGAGAQVEMLTTDNNAGITAIDLTGNALVNTIYGNAGANVLDGRGGADTLVGLGGDDWYFVDNAADVVSEGAADGVADRVFASVSYTLTAGAFVERLTTDNNAGTGAINLTGNALANLIYGNAGNNLLDGLGGNDILVGGLGNDTMTGGLGDDFFYVDSVGDVVVETAGQGTDRVFAGVSYTLAAGVDIERLTTDDNAATTAINLTGNELANIIYGNAGTNVLDGKGGNDILVGDGGSNTYAFTTALGAGNIDIIGGFSVAGDTILLENAVFTGLGAGALAAGAFNTGSAATQLDDRIIYNSANGVLLFDADGLGGAAGVQFALVSTGLALTASDFLVI